MTSRRAEAVLEHAGPPWLRDSDDAFTRRHHVATRNSAPPGLHLRAAIAERKDDAATAPPSRLALRGRAADRSPDVPTIRTLDNSTGPSLIAPAQDRVAGRYVYPGPRTGRPSTAIWDRLGSLAPDTITLSEPRRRAVTVQAWNAPLRRGWRRLDGGHLRSPFPDPRTQKLRPSDTLRQASVAV